MRVALMLPCQEDLARMGRHLLVDHHTDFTCGIIRLHDIAEGRIERCQVCGTAELEEVIDLGHQPLCDSLLTAEQLGEPQIVYPLRLVRCPSCTLAQLDYAVSGKTVYHEKYPYRSGITQPLVSYFDAMSSELVDEFRPDLVVDIGSNDGTLLTCFRARGCRVMGVEPTNVAQFAERRGITTIQAFFTEQVAEDIVAEYGHASLVTATNVFAHMAELGETIRGMRRLIGKSGIIVIENHYLLDVLEQLQFDTIYHEHIRTYSLRSLVVLFDHYDLEIVDARRVSRYGGNIRVRVAPKGRQNAHASVSELLKRECDSGLDRAEPYSRFRERVQVLKCETMEFLYQRRNAGCRIVGNSCPGRCSTLINYYGIDRDLVPYIAELPASLKKGLYMPGKLIPVVDNSVLTLEQPDYIILFAWHYADVMAKNLRASGVKSDLIQLLPDLRIMP